ncbi:MAG: UDP-N-acetylmuramoyl-L-alanyl-D-glutamate--2,6-diaminopimelate ligase, partial [Lachnospiraceae bacterium]|nr:UDP-N-acetylmuramoyl-L-alanyl-D-glutamate--2,6-diaminopimelate ligase [Lachnospiraceae bacterium]
MFALKELLRDFDHECVKGTVEKQISEVVTDNRKITKDCLFICVIGTNFDGHSAAAEAAEKGAAAILVSKDVEVPDNSDVTVIKVADTRYAMAFVAAAINGHPGDKLKVIGITGTKGKTTTTYLVKSILEHAGYKVGLVGTIEAIIGDKHIPAHNTTPDTFVLQDYFRRMVEEGCQVCVMEVSSQGLMLHRTQGFTFELGIFTNIEPDHIGPGEHKDFEDYMACKG